MIFIYLDYDILIFTGCHKILKKVQNFFNGKNNLGLTSYE